MINITDDLIHLIDGIENIDTHCDVSEDIETIKTDIKVFDIFYQMIVLSDASNVQHVFDYFCDTYNGLRENYTAEISTESFIDTTLNILNRIFESIIKLIKKIVDFISSIFKSRVKRASTIKLHVDNIKMIRNIELDMSKVSDVDDFSLITSRIVDFKLFEKRFNTFSSIYDKLHDLGYTNDRGTEITEKTAKEIIGKKLNLEDPSFLKIGIDYNSETHLLRFINAGICDYRKTYRVRDANHLATMVRDYEKSTIIFEHYLALESKISNELKNIARHLEFLNTHKGEIIGPDGNADNNKNAIKMRGSLHMCERMTRILGDLSKISESDLQLIETTTAVISRFMTKHRKNIFKS